MAQNQMTIAQWKKLIEQTKKSTGYTPSQIRKISGQDSVMQRQDDSAFKLEAEKLEAIKQQNSKGLQVFDVTPRNLDRSEYFCAYEGSITESLIGVENVNNVSLAGAGNLYYDNTLGTVDSRAVVAPYWRTIFIPVAGNFLKVEYLPSRIGADGGDLSLNVSGGSQRIQNAIEPANTSEPNVYDFYAPFSPTYYNANKVSSDRIILLDFNTPTDRPIIAKHGERFKTYFSGVYVTFKQNSPRIRITIGSNAEISTVDDRPSSLHLWRGHGLLNDSFVNPVPYEITDSDFVTSKIGIETTSNIVEYCLVANPTASAAWEQNGLGLFWINSIFFNFFQTANDNESTVIKFSLYVKSLGTLASNYVTGSVKIKRLFERTIVSETTGEHSNVETSFPEPMRIALRKDTGLFLRIQPLYASSTKAIKNYFSICGYSLGPMQGIKRSATTVSEGPFFNRYKLGENPYPIDLDDYGMPMN